MKYIRKLYSSTLKENTQSRIKSEQEQDGCYDKGEFLTYRPRNHCVLNEKSCFRNKLIEDIVSTSEGFYCLHSGEFSNFNIKNNKNNNNIITLNDNNNNNQQPAPRNVRTTKDSRIRQNQRLLNLTKRHLESNKAHGLSLNETILDDSGIKYNATLGNTSNAVYSDTLSSNNTSTNSKRHHPSNAAPRATLTKNVAKNGNAGKMESVKTGTTVGMISDKSAVESARYKEKAIAPDSLSVVDKSFTPAVISENNKRHYGRDPRDCYGHNNQSKDNWESVGIIIYRILNIELVVYSIVLLE